MSSSAQGIFCAWSGRAGNHSLYKRLLLGTALAALVTAPALANPTGGQVSTGAAAITSSGNNTAVKQTSEGVVINWSSFNIGNGQTMQFYQPNAQALAVNRIGSKNASQILGTLDANGNVVLINGNGLLFGKNARVNVGSLVATSTDGTDSDLLAGKFTKAGSQSATIVNHGVITVGTGGTVALVAPNVTNTGVVNAKLGTVSLGAANKFTVDLNGDGLVSFAAQGDVNGKASVINRGRLVGANVSMTAHAAEGIATGVVNTSGVVVAQGAHEVGGTIVLDAGDGGAIDISGGKLEAKGPKGGGTITVGSWSNQSVTVNSGAMLNASATKTGNGGHIQVVSNSTSFAGNALAQGGVLSGNGGLIETSGHTLDFLGSSINASATHGKAGTWLLDPDDLTIDSADALEISNTLGSSGSGTDVSLQTTSSGCSGGFGTCVAGSGDINIEGTISWGSSATLSLDAYHSLNILAPISVTGAGSLALQYNDEGTDGVLNFGLTSSGFTGSVRFGATNNGGTLSINGTPYTLEYDLGVFESDVLTNSGTGNYALASSIDATSSNYTSSPVPEATMFTGTFEGLGNTISNFTLNDAVDSSAGFFSKIGAGGVVRDLRLANASVTGTNSNNADVGILAGQNAGTIINVAVSGSATDDNGSNTVAVGGLVGLNSGTISYSNAGASVSGDFEAYVGGLVGDNEGAVSYAYATGSVTADDSGAEGGLVGVNGLTTTASIDHSYATGAVGDPANTINADLGGLVGANDGNGSITYSYATGSVSGTDGNFTGGLVGYNNGGSISYAYAMGAVVSDENAYVGGLIGNNEGSVTQTYSTGDVVDAQSGASVGGLVGFDGTKTDITDSYWDMSTSGIGATQGSGNIANESGITGKTTANLQGTLPSGFDNTVWGTGTGLYPYFLWQYPTSGGTPQFISGTAYTDAGATIDADDAVVGRIDGSLIGRTSSGANGYYYFLVAPGSLSGTDAAYVATASGVTVADNLSGSQTGLDIWGSYFRDFTAETTLSAAYGDVDFASGNNNEIAIIYNNIPNISIQSSAASFTLDGPLAPYANNTVKTTAGDLTLAYQQEQFDGTLTLDSYGSIYVQGQIGIDAGANLTLVTNDGGSGGNLDFQGGLAEFDSGASQLTINSTPYTIVFGLPKLISDIAANPSGDYAFSPPNGTFESTGTYTSASIPTTFTGKLEGLGSIIDGLTISDTNGSDNVGLFANIGAGGSVENLTLLDASVTSASGGNIGGFAGVNGGSVFNVYIAGSVTATSSSNENVGGFVGNNSGTITGSGFDGAIAEEVATAGGFAGLNNSGGTITTSYALGSISGSGPVAGFVDTNLGQITNSYTTAAVTGGPGNLVAGFASYNTGTISNSYTAPTLSGGSTQYGFIGTNSSGTITNSVWDEDTTGDHGTGYGSNTGTITGLTGVTSSSGITAYDESTYSGLGFTFGTGGDWYMIDGQTRPFLQAEYSTYILNAHQLQLMAMNLTGEYDLGANITYDGTMWTTAGFVPVGTSTNPFQGQLESDGEFAISGLVINRPSQDYVGIIGYAGDSTDISGVSINGGSVTGEDYVGALAGYSSGSGIEDDSSATVTGTYDSSTLIGGNRVGGLIGDYEGSGFGESEATGNVSGNQYVGGAIGYIGTDALVEDITTEGNVSGIEYAGGFAGYNNGAVEAVGASGNVTASAPSPTSSAVVQGIGGVVGVNGPDADMIEGIAFGNVSATGTNTNPARAVGGVAGSNLGEIDVAASEGTVSGQAEVGGSVGYNDGVIAGAYSTGKTTGDVNIGGLVGYNDVDGFIGDSYSLSAVSVVGSVNGHDGDVGGLVGNNQGEIEDAFSAGMVTCSASDSCAGTIGGFVGLDNGVIDATSYFDTFTSGIPSGHGIGKDLSGDATNVVGEGTATLQSGLPAGWDTSIWQIVPGVSYPYLIWQTGGASLQVVSGLVQNASGTKNIAGVDVSVLVDGLSGVDNYVEGAMASGADGYYYVMLSPYLPISGGYVLAYITDPGLAGNTVETRVSGGSLSNVAVHEGVLSIHTSDANSALLTSDLDDAVGDNTGAQFLFTETGTFTPGAQITVFDSASSFNVNSALDFGTANVDLMETGYVTENPTTGSITAADLSGTSSGGVKLTGDNEVGQILGWTNNGGSFTFDDGEQLRIGGEIDAGANLTLTTTSGGINIDAELDAGNTISLNSAGAIGENATTGSLDAVSLNGSSEGGVSLQGTNTISNLNAFDTNGGAFNLDVDGPLRVGGEVQTGAGNLTLDSTAGSIGVDAELLTTGTADLLATGNISENASGVIDAARLGGGTLGGGVSLSSTNMIGELETFDTNGSGFSLTDGETLTTIGTLNAGTADVSLTTTSGDIDIDGAIDAHRLDLNSHGAANESGHGAIDVQVLNVTAVTGIDLDSAQNDIVGVGNDTTVSGPNTIRKN